LVEREWIRTHAKGGELTERTLEGKDVKAEFLDRQDRLRQAEGTVRRNDTGELVIESWADGVRQETAVSRNANVDELAESPSQHPAANISRPSAGRQPSQATEGRKAEQFSDPREWKTVTLGTSNADPKIRLLRSLKYRQMQIQFDRDPDDKYKEMLAKAGWRDRTEEEGIWTKQIPRGSGWQPAAEAERLFKQIANQIRADKGLETVMGLD
jgi:hypothetical protein